MNKIVLKQCKICGRLNPGDSARCTDCNTRWERSYGELLNGDWIDGPKFTSVWACPKCKFVNPIDNNTCGGCFFKPSSGSLCFLTTIVVTELDKSDDCRELNLMRKLRQDYLLKFSEGQKIMKDYYLKSEYVTTKISNLENKHTFCEDIYNIHLIPVTDLVEKENYEMATEKYLNMVNFVVKSLS